MKLHCALVAEHGRTAFSAVSSVAPVSSGSNQREAIQRLGGYYNNMTFFFFVFFSFSFCQYLSLVYNKDTVNIGHGSMQHYMSFQNLAFPTYTPPVHDFHPILIPLSPQGISFFFKFWSSTRLLSNYISTLHILSK